LILPDCHEPIPALKKEAIAQNHLQQALFIILPQPVNDMGGWDLKLAA